jgi:hypothetical protein
MNLRSFIEKNIEQTTSTISENANERFMIVVPEALHSFPVC